MDHRPIPDFELQGNNNISETETRLTMEVDTVFYKKRPSVLL